MRCIASSQSFFLYELAVYNKKSDFYMSLSSTGICWILKRPADDDAIPCLQTEVDKSHKLLRSTLTSTLIR